MQGPKRFAGVDMQKTSEKEIIRQIIHVPKMDASVPVYIAGCFCKTMPRGTTLLTSGSRRR